MRAALAAVLVRGTAPELALVHRWLDNWRGVGQIAEGMHRAGWDLQLTEYGDGHWRATFYVRGQVHSVVGGSAWQPNAWTAVQRAGWDVLNEHLEEHRRHWMNGGDDHRTRSQEMWREVMQADAPPVSDPYTEMTTDHLMGRIWTRPGLSRRDRRLVTLTIAAVAGQRDPLRNHLRASLESRDLSITEIHEWIVHLAHYGGWPAGTTAYAVLREVSDGGGRR